jgi:predicted transcriptional regulator of viral defense system
VGYESKIGGLDAVATILAELAEKLDADKLHALAPIVPIPWVQRLGYLLERVDAAPKAERLKEYVKKHTHDTTMLVPSAPIVGHIRDSGWKLTINAEVEAEA